MINHIEYAAANYGKNFYQKSRSSDETEKLRQYLVFKQTLENLRREYGNEGMVYLNDISVKDLEYMLAKIQGYYPELCSGIEFRLLPGDLYKIEHPKTKTAHLKFLPHISGTPAQEFRNKVHNLIISSRKGIEFTAEQWLTERVENALGKMGKFESECNYNIKLVGIDVYKYQATFGELTEPSKTIVITAI